MLLISRSPMDQSYINSIMNKHISYNFVLILIIIQCVKSQDNDPDQPADDDGEEDNFEVLDLDEIIQERISRFEDPQYLPDYQQLQESQYSTQPQTQPQQYPGYQPESQGFQTQPQYHDVYQPEHQYYPGYQQQHQQYPGYQTDTYGYYEPPQAHVTQQLDQYYQPTTAPQTSHTEITQSPQTQQTQSETVEEDDNFYVTEHDQPHQGPSATETGFIYGPTQPTQEPIHYIPPTTQQPRKRKRKRPQPISGDQGDEEGDGEELVEVQTLIRPKKSIHIKFYKRNYLGNLEEMTEGDYLIIFSDTNKTEYMFIVDLEQLEFNNVVIYEHISGTPYCSSLIHSKKTNVFVMTNIQGFTLVKKSKGIWTTTDHVTPDFVRMFTKNEEDKLIYLTKENYTVTFTSNASFRYTLIPGVKCHKIVVKWLTVWEKTDEDEEFPLFFYVSNKLRVFLNFEKYTKIFVISNKKYRLSYTRKNYTKAKYS